MARLPARARAGRSPSGRSGPRSTTRRRCTGRPAPTFPSRPAPSGGRSRPPSRGRRRSRRRRPSRGRRRRAGSRAGRARARPTTSGR
jgi:hypothetical protein